MASEQAPTRRALIVAIAPVQVLSALIIAKTKLPGDVASCDLVILDQFTQADELAERVREQGVFDNVYLARLDEHKQGLYTARTLLNALFARKRLEERLVRQCGEDFAAKRYDLMYFSAASSFTFMVKNLCVKHGSSVLFDDGSGSYSGAIINRLLFLDTFADPSEFGWGAKAKLRHGFKRCLNALTRGSLTFDVRRVLLFSPSSETEALYKGAAVEKLELAGEGLMPLIDRVFRIPAEVRERYALAKAVYFGLPDVAVPSEVIERDAACARAMVEALGERAVIRAHPRASGRPEGIPEEVYDDASCSWEVLALTMESGRFPVLAGMGSSAQLSPKRLFGGEPRLIYLYKLLPEGFAHRTTCENEWSNACALYSEPERISCPETIEAFAGTLTDTCQADA